MADSISHAMPLVQASADIDVVLERMEADRLVDDITNVLSATFNNPAIPMLARVAGMAAMVAGAANGALEVMDEGGSAASFHRNDLIPDIAKMLRASATIYEALAEGLERESTPVRPDA